MSLATIAYTHKTYVGAILTLEHRLPIAVPRHTWRLLILDELNNDI
jgi:hypothetical protein